MHTDPIGDLLTRIRNGIGARKETVDKGAAILLLLPAKRSEWNGKLFVTAHGRGRSFQNGALRVWDRYLQPADPMAAFDRIDRVMLSKGYAVAVTKRTSEQGRDMGSSRLASTQEHPLP